MKLNLFVPKYAAFFILASFSFSTIGLLLPTGTKLENPLHAMTIHEASGHFLWGLAAGAITLNPVYILLSGLFASFVDADHLIYFFHADALPRMSHSILFGVVSTVILIILKRRDYLLGSLGFASVLSHISFDIFDGEHSSFPFFAPFYNQTIKFENTDWVYFEIAAVIVVTLGIILSRKRNVQKVEV